MPFELRRPLLWSGLIACLLAAAMPGAAGSAPCPVPDTTSVIRTVSEVMARERIPGLVVGFTLDTCTWVRAFGTADVENGTPTLPNSSFRLASVQKTMTAVAVLQLAERGKLDLDAPIQRYVPHFPRKPWAVTARLLLSHLGGIPHYVNRDVEQRIREHRSTRQAIAIFAAFDLIAEPGTKYSYSSYGYNLLGAAIEGASGLSYAEYMRTHVWAPAGMLDTRMDDPREIVPRRVRGYQLVGDTLRNSEFIDVSSRFAAGGTRGTVPDLLRFMAALDAGRLLRDSTRAAMTRPARTRDGSVVPYAMGWQIPPFRDRRALVMNDGGQQETRTFILSDPDHHARIALAMNLEADVYGPIVLELYRALTGRTLVVER
jgi:CubicO group peptidase (beta-lactamase class C family)